MILKFFGLRSPLQYPPPLKNICLFLAAWGLSRGMAQGLSSCSTRAKLPWVMWNPSSPTGDGTRVPALEGGFLTTEPPGKCPRFTLLIIENHKKFFKSHLLIFTDYKLKLRKLKHENTYIYTPLILKVKSSHSIWPLENSTLQLWENEWKRQICLNII